MNAPMVITPAGDILANIDEMDWLDVGGGSYFKVLRLCEKTGQWVLYVRMEPGHRFQGLDIHDVIDASVGGEIGDSAFAHGHNVTPTSGEPVVVR